MYAITGASGQLGRLVVDRLLTTVPAAQLVAVVRTPERMADLARQGVQVRAANYDSPGTLRSAFAGVERLLLISSNEVAGRFAQHKAVIDAARIAGVGRLVYTSMLRADTSVAKLAIEHKATEEEIRRSGVPFVLLRNGWYTENLLLALKSALEHGAMLGAAGAGRFSTAGRADYAEAAVAALLADDPADQVFELAGDDAFTVEELVDEVARQSGKPVRYDNLSQADYKAALVGAGLPEGLADMLADADAAAAGGALFDDHGQLRRLIGHATTPMPASVAKALAAVHSH